MTSMRTKGKSTIVWLLLGMLLLGLGGFGVTNFSGGGTGTIGSVGDTRISTADYLRAIRNQMQSFSAQTGQNMTAEQAKALGLTQTVQAQLFTGAALEDEAARLGVSVGDETVAKRVTEAPAFQTPGGQFDRARYDEVLRQQGLEAADFEQDVRTDEARLIVQRAVTGGVKVPATLRDRSAAWLLEHRDLSWAEVTADQLSEPVAAPDDDTLVAWHKANAARFTAPETRRITYVSLTPEMLADTVELDDEALRDLYQQRIAEFQQPERRMVERLVYPSEAEAQAAKARLDAGQASFEQLVNERGLQLSDIDLGEVTQPELGDAGAAVFALDQPGVVGPIKSPLGPALFSMNAILDPVNVSFEDAAPDLRAEAAADRARRVIEEQSPQFEDLLAGGTTLEDMPKSTPMQLGHIDYSSETPSEGIAAYQAFRDRAAKLTAQDFPEIVQLDGGGIVAMRLDELVPPALIPLDKVRDRVLADWTQAETSRRLKALADEMLVSADVPADAAPAAVAPAQTATPAAGEAPKPAAPAFRSVTDMPRDGAIDGAVPALLAQAFRLKEQGDMAVVQGDGRVFLVRLDRVIPADLTADDAKTVVEGVNRRLTESLQADLFEYYARAIQQARGVTVDSAAIAAADARIQ